MAAPKTVYTYDLDGTNRDFPIPFEYLTRKFIQVTLIGTDRQLLTLNIDYRFTQRTVITTSKAWGPGDGYERIELRRYTSATERLVDFNDGSILKAYDLNTSQVQSLHIAEEGRDVATDTIGTDNDGNLDARGRRIVNLADATEDGHAVTLRQEREWAASTLSNRNASKASADASEVSAVRSDANRAESLRQAGLAEASAGRAKVSEDSAKDSARIATEEIAKIDGQVALAAGHADRSKVSADKAFTEADRATRSANTSGISASAAVAAKVAAQDAAKAAADSGIQLGMSAWGYRKQLFKGFGLDDGQELDRALYPDFAAALDAGLFPVVSEALWQSNPANRGCFVALSSPGKFRMRDLNGASLGSIGATFQRGSTDQSVGIVKKDQLGPMMYADNVADTTTNPYIRNGTGRNAILTRGLATGQPQAAPVGAANDGSQWVTNTGPETVPKHVTGAWMTRLYGVITPLGSAEASSLATAYTSMASRVSVLESARPRRWRSGTLAVSSTATTFNHGLGVVPDDGWVYWTLVTAVGGWPAGQVFRQPLLNLLNTSSGSYGHQVTALTATTFSLNYAQYGPIMLGTNGVANAIQASGSVEFYTLGS